jgi:excisionase family DNA binding protein
MPSNISSSPAPASRWLTVAQAAEYLGVSERTIKRWIWNGQLTPSKPGGDYGKCYLKPADLDDLMEKSRAR